MSDRDQRFSEDNPQQQNPSEGSYVIEEPSVVVPLKGQFQQKTIKKNQIHLFSGFCEYPDKISFHNQEEDETILLFVRKSQIVNLPWILTTLILIIAPLILLIIPRNLFPLTVPMSLVLILSIGYFLWVITYAFINFVIWYYNAALITNKRIVDIDFHQLVYKDIAETKLALVQDVSYRQQSVIENFFDFGHVLIQTAGTIDNFEFSSLPKPDRIEEIVNELIGKGRVYVP